MPIRKGEGTTVAVQKSTAVMLKILRGRAAASGQHATSDDLIVYMIETLYSDVYRHVMYGDKLGHGDNGNGDDHQTLIVRD